MHCYINGIFIQKTRAESSIIITLKSGTAMVFWSTNRGSIPGIATLALVWLGFPISAIASWDMVHETQGRGGYVIHRLEETFGVFVKR